MTIERLNFIFASGECPQCGKMCGNEGEGPLRCECGWVDESPNEIIQRIKRNRKDLVAYRALGTPEKLSARLKQPTFEEVMCQVRRLCESIPAGCNKGKENQCPLYDYGCTPGHWDKADRIANYVAVVMSWAVENLENK